MSVRPIIAILDILKVAKGLSEIRDCWILLTFSKVFSPKQDKLNKISHFFLRYQMRAPEEGRDEL